MESGHLQSSDVNNEASEAGSWHPARRPETLAKTDETEDGDANPPLVRENAHIILDSEPSTTSPKDVLPKEFSVPLQTQSSDLGLDLQPAFSRSPSFPEVPPLHLKDDSDIKAPLLHSHAEDIMSEIGETNPVESSGLDTNEELHGNILISSPFDNEPYREVDNFFSNTSGIGSHEVSLLADEEARFEEGIPLIQGLDIRGSKQEINFDAPGGSNDDFFAQISASPSNEDFFKPQRLDRKTTNQIQNSMKFPPHEETHDTQSAHRGSLQDLTGGSMATSTSTTIPEVVTAEMTSDDKREIDGGFLQDLSDKSMLEGNQKSDQDLDALWQAALDDDDLLEDEQSPVDSFAFFDKDGDGFLDEQGTDEQVRGFNNINATNVQATAKPDEPHQITPLGFSPQYTNSMQPLPYTATSAFPSNYSQSPINYTGAGQSSPYGVSGVLPRPGMPEKTQSFVDKAKGGYTSPYDLPMDVASRPKKRTIPYQLPSKNQNLANIPTPPPRSSSFNPSTAHTNGPTSSKISPTASTRPSLPPTAFSPIPPPTNLPGASSKSTKEAFFEELPIASKPRPLNKWGKTSSPSSPPVSASLLTPDQQALSGQQPNMPQGTVNKEPNSTSYQLLPPERVSPYANTTTTSNVNQSLPALNPRYSPAPSAHPGLPPNRARYATTTPVGPPRPPSVTLPFQPRTSSPLTRSTSAIQQYQVRSQSIDDPSPPEAFPSESRRPSLRSYHTERPLPPPSEIHDSQEITATASAPFRENAAVASDPERKQRSLPYHHPLEQSHILSPNIPAFDSPRRSQTQSPNSMVPQSDVRVIKDYENQRRAFVNDVTSPGASKPHFGPHIPPMAPLPPSEKSLLPKVNFLIPSDGREHDPLERWKGCPVFFFGFGGMAVTSFPKQVPRFAVGQPIPLIKCSPGEVKLRTEKLLSLDERIVSFPGPLKSKSKKKDVLEWLEKSIQQLSRQYVALSPNHDLGDSRKRHDEKVLLWKVLRILVEYDGVIDGNHAAENAVRMALSPELITGESTGQISYDSNLPLSRISRSSTRKNLTSMEDPEALEGLRKLLLQGEREKAVWHAVDQRLWGHAILLASTLSREIWKQVVQEFVRNEVKTYGENTESLAALYEIFAGNWEESIDELVPPSARAGLQMISKTAGPGTTKNALDGLDRWRETLSLVMSNRTLEDGRALVSLGQLLSKYGRIEAAHVCFMFARSQTIFGGPDDSQVNVVLFGTDHMQQPFDYVRDLDSVLLTEAYEFALNVLGPSSASNSTPHLQAHKLYHAMILAEYGYRDEAQQYCDIIQNTLKATTKLSPYYHSRLFSALDDLSSRLKQAPKDGSSSWIGRPSMDKVSGSVWNKFHQFVSGDDSDAASIGSGKGIDGEAGPFSRVSGDTPTISRGPSPNNQFGSYTNGTLYTPEVPGPTLLHTPYAPAGGIYTPRSSLEQPRHEEQFTNSLHDPSKVHVGSLKPVSIQRQPSYSLLPISSSDLDKKHQRNGRPLIARPSTSSLNSSKRDYSPAPPVPGFSEEAPSNPSYPSGLHESFPSDSPVYSQNLTSPDGYTTSMYLEDPLVQQDNHSDIIESASTTYKPSPANNEAYSTEHESFSDQQTPTYPTELSPTSNQPLSRSYSSPSADTEPLATSYGYEPPMMSSYDPPNYEPYSENGDISPVNTKPKKKSLLEDDDDDFEAKAAAVLKKEKNPRGRKPDDAVRRAAEEDGKQALHLISHHVIVRFDC